MFKWLLIGLLTIIAVLFGILVWLCAGNRTVPQVSVTGPPEKNESPNVTVFVHQSAVNNLLQTIFPIEGEGHLLGKPLKIPYAWKIDRPHAEMTDAGPIFSADAQVYIFGTTYNAKAEGMAGIRYDSLGQILYMELRDLQIHSDIKVLGISLDGLKLAPSDLDILLLRKLPLLAHFVVKKPKSVFEDVGFYIVSNTIRFEKKQAVVDFTVRFRELSQQVRDTTNRTIVK